MSYFVAADSFCRIIATNNKTWTHYDLTASLYDDVDMKRTGFGLVGVIYNVQDVDNFDFVVFAIR